MPSFDVTLGEAKRAARGALSAFREKCSSLLEARLTTRLGPPREDAATIPALSGPYYSVVIPARNAGRSLPRVLAALASQEPAPLEVIVVDDASTDATAAVARDAGARVVATEGRRFAGGARNTGWRAAQGDLVVFLDADAVPTPGWAAALVSAAAQFPGAIVGCARAITAPSAWGWVARLQVETPYLARGGPRDTAFVSSFCMVVPRGLPLVWDENYGAEDAFFSADASAAGIRLVFDPRIVARHEHERGTFAELRSQQERLAWGMARAARAGLLSRRRAILVRVPLPYFLLLRLPGIYRRLDGEPELRRRFVRLLPRLALAEWTLGWSALGYAFRPPPARGGAQPLFT
jgi:glycosyltransferase involved in cell wall biosynthesis